MIPKVWTFETGSGSGVEAAVLQFREGWSNNGNSQLLTCCNDGRCCTSALTSSDNRHCHLVHHCEDWDKALRTLSMFQWGIVLNFVKTWMDRKEKWWKNKEVRDKNQVKDSSMTKLSRRLMTKVSTEKKESTKDCMQRVISKKRNYIAATNGHTYMMSYKRWAGHQYPDS